MATVQLVSILSTQLAPGSVYISQTARFNMAAPLRVITGAVRSLSIVPVLVVDTSVGADTTVSTFPREASGATPSLRAVDQARVRASIGLTLDRLY